LIYTTCSCEPEDDEQVAAEFLRRTASFVQLDVREAAPAVPATLVDANGHLRTYPHLHGLEGFFGAVFSRVR
jgi:16S rRNA (cytosine967-C5)-methyltransferase